MPNEMNYIAVPESLKGQIEEQGSLEIDYSLVEENGVTYLKVTGVEGNPVESEPESPEAKMKKKMGYSEESETEMMM